MSEDVQPYQFQQDERGSVRLLLRGDWSSGNGGSDFAPLERRLTELAPSALLVDGSGLQGSGSLLEAALLKTHDFCSSRGIEFSTEHIPDSAHRLLQLATAVPAQQRSPAPALAFWARLDPLGHLRQLKRELQGSFAFVGDISLAMARLLAGRANTRFSDFRQFCFQAGPNAFGIISLTSVLVGMILAYLGAVQLQQFGAGIYVADLVVIGMLREMGVLMAAIVMAGRTGAAYAAQLGTMQTNEEIDAITTMGISPMEFLVLPRMLALVVMMPLLTLYANVLGIIGGGLVAFGMGITPLQYINEGSSVLAFSHLSVGLIKSVVFGILIAVAGCRSGINSGRSSAAVGQAATEAVVTAIVYLIVADAAINIACQQFGI